MRRNRQPFAVAAGPYIGIAAGSRKSIGRGVGSASVDDREISHQTNVDIVSLEIGDLDRDCGLLEETVAVEKRAVGKRAQEIVGENFPKSRNVGHLDRSDVIAIQFEQSSKVRRESGLCLHGVPARSITPLGALHSPETDPIDELSPVPLWKFR